MPARSRARRAWISANRQFPATAVRASVYDTRANLSSPIGRRISKCRRSRVVRAPATCRCRRSPLAEAFEQIVHVVSRRLRPREEGSAWSRFLRRRPCPNRLLGDFGLGYSALLCGPFVCHICTVRPVAPQVLYVRPAGPWSSTASRSTVMSSRRGNCDIFVDLGAKDPDLPIELTCQILSPTSVPGQLAAGGPRDLSLPRIPSHRDINPAATWAVRTMATRCCRNGSWR
jgi:hypothetical protein